jgi:hypothetical protein
MTLRHPEEIEHRFQVDFGEESASLELIQELTQDGDGGAVTDGHGVDTVVIYTGALLLTRGSHAGGRDSNKALFQVFININFQLLLFVTRQIIQAPKWGVAPSLRLIDISIALWGGSVQFICGEKTSVNCLNSLGINKGKGGEGDNTLPPVCPSVGNDSIT